MTYPPNQPGAWGNDPHNQHGGFPPDPRGSQPSGPGQYPHDPSQVSGAGAAGPYVPQSGQPDPYNAPVTGQPNPWGTPQDPGAYGAPASQYGGYDPYQPPPPEFGAGNYGQPPNKNHTGLIIGIVATVLLVVVLGVGGFLLFAGGNDNKSGDDKANSDHQTNNDSNKNDSKSRGKRISPAGAPYELELPSGFKQVSVPSSASDIGHDTIAIAPERASEGSNDIIVLTVVDQDSSDFNSIKENVSESSHITDDTTVRVDGKKSLQLTYDVEGTSGGTYTYRPLSNGSTLYVGTQWEDYKSDIESGYQDLIDSLTITE